MLGRGEAGCSARHAEGKVATACGQPTLVVVESGAGIARTEGSPGVQQACGASAAGSRKDDIAPHSESEDMSHIDRKTLYAALAEQAYELGSEM